MAVWPDHLKRGGKSRRKPVFSFLGDILRTRVYVDGYNLYYGCLKGTRHKWLDPLQLFERILPTVTATIPGRGALTSELDALAIKFCTALILERAAKAKDSLSSQERYHSALNKHLKGRLEMLMGYYSLTEARARVIDADDPRRLVRDCSAIPVWKLEEKQSDVNLALHAVVDALQGGIEHVVFVTNDTDIEPALKMIRAKTNVAVGLIVPTTDHARKPNGDLVKHAHWVKSHITEGELQAAQLPLVIMNGTRKAIAKPASWYARPDLLERALALGTEHYGSEGKALRWLNTKNPHYANRTPIDLLESGDESVLRFMEQYARPAFGETE